ncbi:MAG: peroxidase family protein [Acidobacteriota bacterium]|nr:peroxidase family protein [Acidobacteriota bacterium]
MLRLIVRPNPSPLGALAVALGLLLGFSMSINAQPAQPPAQATAGGDTVRAEARISTAAPSVLSPRVRQGRLEIDRQRLAEAAPYRSLDGTGNNLLDSETGATYTTLLRLLPSDYGDGISSLAGPDRPSARAISNLVTAQPSSFTNDGGITDYLWQWGQFLDHDMDLTEGNDPPEAANIVIPMGDPFFDPEFTGTATMSLNRSVYDLTTGTGVDNPRQQLNEITAWIDASNVYGSDEFRAAALRTLDGTGRLLTSSGNLLPFNTLGMPNAGGDGPELFLAGDVRANEQAGLTAMHTLFVREHNRLAQEIALAEPSLDGEEIYQRARRMVGALMQAVTYNEFLPLLLGPDALPPYSGYRPDLDARISNLFATAAYRFGHSALSPVIRRLDAQGEEIQEGHLPLRDAFFAPHRIADEGGIEPILRGLASQACQVPDPMVVDDLRNFLFGAPGSGGFDLTALNIQRGRDHGLPSYNDTRRGLGLPPAAGFSDITSDPMMSQRILQAYGDVEQVDLWVGGLAEDAVPGSMLGEVFTLVLVDQFTALRDADRFWYQRILSPQELAEVESTRLSDIIRRNTPIGDEIQDDIFLLP